MIKQKTGYYQNNSYTRPKYRFVLADRIGMVNRHSNTVVDLTNPIIVKKEFVPWVKRDYQFCWKRRGK
jgi:hypothetical protein